MFIAQVTAEKTHKRKLVEDEVKDLNTKKARLQKDLDALTKSADTFALQAEQKGDLTLIAKSNSLRKSAKEKSTELSNCLQVISDKLLELQNC